MWDFYFNMNLFFKKDSWPLDLTRSPEFDAREEEMCVKFDKRSRLTLHLLGHAGAGLHGDLDATGEEQGE